MAAVASTRPASDISIRPLTPVLGAEVTGVDLGTLTEAGFTAVTAAFDRHGVILVRGQRLSPAGVLGGLPSAHRVVDGCRVIWCPAWT